MKTELLTFIAAILLVVLGSTTEAQDTSVEDNNQEQAPMRVVYRENIASIPNAAGQLTTTHEVIIHSARNLRTGPSESFQTAATLPNNNNARILGVPVDLCLIGSFTEGWLQIHQIDVPETTDANLVDSLTSLEGTPLYIYTFPHDDKVGLTSDQVDSSSSAVPEQLITAIPTKNAEVLRTYTLSEALAELGSTEDAPYYYAFQRVREVEDLSSQLPQFVKFLIGGTLYVADVTNPEFQMRANGELTMTLPGYEDNPLVWKEKTGWALPQFTTANGFVRVLLDTDFFDNRYKIDASVDMTYNGGLDWGMVNAIQPNDGRVAVLDPDYACLAPDSSGDDSREWLALPDVRGSLDASPLSVHPYDPDEILTNSFLGAFTILKYGTANLTDEQLLQVRDDFYAGEMPMTVMVTAEERTWDLRQGVDIVYGRTPEFPANGGTYGAPDMTNLNTGDIVSIAEDGKLTLSINTSTGTSGWHASSIYMGILEKMLSKEEIEPDFTNKFKFDRYYVLAELSRPLIYDANGIVVGVGVPLVVDTSDYLERANRPARFIING